MFNGILTPLRNLEIVSAIEPSTGRVLCSRRFEFPRRPWSSSDSFIRALTENRMGCREQNVQRQKNKKNTTRIAKSALVYSSTVGQRGDINCQDQETRFIVIQAKIGGNRGRVMPDYTKKPTVLRSVNCSPFSIFDQKAAAASTTEYMYIRLGMS